MFHPNRIVVVGLMCVGLNVVACNSARDVEVSGTVSAESELALGDTLWVGFYDVDQDSVGVEETGIVKLTKPGDFKETVPLEGENVLVRAWDDRDGDGYCTDGEAWGEVTASIANDKAESLVVTLAQEPCRVTKLLGSFGRD